MMAPGSAMMDRKAAPAISVVTPFHNRQVYLQGLILTLQEQTFKDFELIIVDDGSADSLGEAVAGLQVEFPLRYIKFEVNRGAAAARNAGMDAAAGRYVALLDSDDSWHPEKLDLQYQQLERGGRNSRLVSLTRQIVKGRGTYLAPSQAMTRTDCVGNYLFRQGGVIQSSMMMLPRDLGTRVRFEENSRGHDDWSFALRLEAAGARFEMLEQPLTIYDDAAGRTRRSPSYSAARLDWLAMRRLQIGEAPYWAAVAAVASHLPGDTRIKPQDLIVSAYRNKGISAARAAYYMIAWLFPPARSWVRQAHHVWASRKAGWPS